MHYTANQQTCSELTASWNIIFITTIENSLAATSQCASHNYSFSLNWYLKGKKRRIPYIPQSEWKKLRLPLSPSWFTNVFTLCPNGGNPLLNGLILYFHRLCFRFIFCNFIIIISSSSATMLMNMRTICSKCSDLTTY